MSTAETWASFDEVVARLDAALFRSPEESFLPPEFLRDPYTPLAALRDELGPVVERSVAAAAGHHVPNPHLLDETKPIFVVLGYDEVVQSLRDTTTSNRGYAASMERVMGRAITMLDGEEHTRIRTLVLQAFRRSAVARWTVDVIQPTIDHLVDRLAGMPAADLVRDLAAPLPFAVTARMMGLAAADFAWFVKMASDLLHLAYDPAAAFAARDALTEYFRGEIEKRRSRPTDDLIGLLVHAEADGQRLTEEEILSNLRELLPAGIETTYRSTGSLWVALLRDRAQYAAVVAEPSLCGSAVEEALRFQSPGSAVPRVATRDMEIGGVAIPAGAGLLVVNGVANRDPRRWRDPDRFDVRRPVQPHLAFIAGPHTCLGLQLARAQMQLSLEAVARRLPGLELAVRPKDVHVVGFLLRAPATCPVMTHTKEGKPMPTRLSPQEMREGHSAIARDLAAAAERWVHPNYVHHDPLVHETAGVCSREEYVAAFRRFKDPMPDLVSSTEVVLVDGDYSAARWRTKGTLTGEFRGAPATNRVVDFWGLTIYRWEDGKVIEGWTLFDVIGFFTQIGMTQAFADPCRGR